MTIKDKIWWCVGRRKWLVTDKELKFALESGMIDVATIQAQYAMKKRNEILENHNFNIWKAKNGYWYTYLPDEVKGRKQIKRKNKTELENAIVNYYETLGTYSVDRLFHIWNTYRLEIGKVSRSTYLRNDYVYNRHLKKYGSKNVELITEEMITDFIEKEVCENHLKYKAYLNLKGVIRGMCQYARRKKIAKVDIESAFADLDLTDRDFDKTRRKEPTMEVFNEKELPLVMNYLESNLDDVRNLAVLLILVSGMRLGEVCVLRLDDWDSDVSFNINRTQTKYKDKKGKVIYEEKETPKTLAGIRNVVIPTKYAYIHQLLVQRNNGTYCFSDRDGNFLKDYIIRQRFYRVCDIVGIPRRSPHDGRRTYATALLNKGANDMFIIDQMGHTNITTTKQYYYRDVRNTESKVKIVDKLIGWMWLLSDCTKRSVSKIPTCKGFEAH